MSNLKLEELYFKSSLKRPLHVQVKRHGTRLLVVVWSRQPNRGERKSGIRTFELKPDDGFTLDAQEYRGHVTIESPEALPYDLSYEGFQRVKVDFTCTVTYQGGIITFAFAPKEYLQ
jgi:hypothetical protein